MKELFSIFKRDKLKIKKAKGNYRNLCKRVVIVSPFFCAAFFMSLERVKAIGFDVGVRKIHDNVFH